MGASFSYRIYENMSIDKAMKEWSKEVDDSLYESGHSYSGEIGMLQGTVVVKPKIDKLEDAITYIEDHHQKWDSGMCVPISNGCVIGGWCSS